MRTLLSPLLALAVISAGTLAAAQERPPAPAPPARQEAAPALPPTPSPAAPVAGQPAPPQEVKPEEEVYTYESARRRDPFYSLISAAKAAEKKKKKFASPLEEYDVYQMKLIAVVRNSNRYALVRLPDGKHYTLREGSVVGIHGGRVSRIDPNSLVVEETISDMKGKSYPKQITLKLREEEE